MVIIILGEEGVGHSLFSREINHLRDEVVSQCVINQILGAFRFYM